MANTQTVIIDFQADFTSLNSGIDTLEQMGKVDKDVADQFRKTNIEIKAQGTTLEQTARKSQTSTQSFGRLADLMKQFPKSGLNRFLLQIGNELSKAGINAKDFYQKLDPKDAVTKQTSLRNELKNVKEQMQQAAIAGGTLGAEYIRLKKRAGELDDTIRDVANDIRNAGSDTRGIDNVVGSISALAGGYSAVQGAVALFGEESEDLQRALLKVNAAMALATGLQQVSNALQKEGALVRLADTVATYGQVAAQKLYTLVVGASTGALKVFKIALASTGIGLLVIGLVALINNMGGASSATKQLKKDLDDLRASTDLAREGIRQEGEITQALLEQQGIESSKRSKEKLKQLDDELTAEQDGLEKIFQKKTEINKKNDELEKRGIAFRFGGLKKINESIDASEKNIRELRQETRLQQIKILDEDGQEREKAAKEQADKQKEINEKAFAAARKRRALEFEDYQAGIELKLLAAEKGGQEELNLQKSLLRAKLQIDLEGEDVTLNQRKLLIQKFFKDRIELEKKFNKDLVIASLEDQKNRDAALLENLNLNEEEKLSVKIEYLQLTAAQEILSAEGNAAKILAINAKLNSDITAAKIDSIKKAADFEIALSSAQGGGQKRALDAVAANEKLKSDVRINAIIQLGQREQQVIDRQIKANRDSAAVIGSDQQALALEYQQLLDQKAAAAEATEKKITDITKTENEKRREIDKANINMTLSALSEANSILSEFQANANQRLMNEIAGKRKAVEDLLEAGAITEKDAKARNKRIDIEEQKAKTKAAQQQKILALFQAAITGAQAIMQAIASAPTPYNIPAIAITAALVAAQIAAIATRPIPKFASGKKGSYKGWGEVGEVGAELIQRADGRMEVATRRQMVYLGSQDKVFTAGETKRMMPFVNKEAISANGKGFEFDYDKLGKAVKQKQSGSVINIDKEFISESVANGLSRVNYFDRYYNSKG